MGSPPARNIGSQNGCDFYQPTSGGKAGTGFNVTSTIQVRRGNQVVKQFRFKVLEPGGREKAIQKARAYAGQSQTAGWMNMILGKGAT